MPIVTRSFRTPCGELLLGAFNGKLCLCDWRYRRMRTTIDARIRRGLQAEVEEGDAPVIYGAIKQLEAYFAGERHTFDLPLRFVGTDFQQRVWKALQEIPFGATITYAKLASMVGEPSAVRAVASANGANALSIIVPCHRVIGSDGSLTGYAGGLGAKRKLLQLEGADIVQATPDLFGQPG